MFGAPSAPFGAPAPSAFGSSPAPFGQQPQQQNTGGFGQPAANNTGFGGGFGQTAQPQQNAFGAAPSTGFGQPQQNAFGAPSTNTGFGQPAQSGGGLFGQAPAPSTFGSPAPATAFGQKPASGGLFGSATPAPSTGLFGAPTPSGGGLFGAAPTPAPFGSPATPFGQQQPAASNAFGAPQQNAFGAPTAFGGQPQQQQTQAGSTVVPYSSTSKQDGNNSIVLQSITAMPQYEQKSFEELRLEDYMAGNKGTKGQATPNTGFGGFGSPAPAPSAFGTQPAAAPTAFGAPAASTSLFGSSPAPSGGGLFGSAPVPAPSFGQPAAAPTAFGAPPAPSTGLFGAPAAAPSGGGLFGAAPTPAPFGATAAQPTAFGQPAAAPSLFGGAKPAATPAFGAPQPAAPFGAPAPSGGLFGAPAPAPSTGLFGAPVAAPSGGLFGSTPTPAKPGGLFGAPAPAPASTGLFGAPAQPATGSSLFGAPTSQPAVGGLFGSPAPAANTGGGLFGASTTVPPANTVPVAPPVSAEALLAQQLAAVENQKKQLELLEAWRGNPPSGSKIVPTSQYDIDSPDNGWGGGGPSSYAASSSALLSYRAGSRSTAKIRPRGYTPTQPSSATTIGRKSGSPILSPNKFVGSATKTLFIKPNSLTPKPKTRLLLTNGVANNGNSPSVAALENGGALPTQQLNGSTPSNGGTTGGTPQTSGSPSTPAQDFYRHVVQDSTVRSPPASSPLVEADKHFVPKLTKPGYNVYPSISELEAMSEADLAAISGFKVERPGFGSVAWEGSVDVRGVDIDAVVVIESKNVSVYDEAEEKGEKPARGSKLNRPAVITMQDIYPKDGAESSTEAKDKLKRKIEKTTKKMGAELLSFEADSGVWTFRVGHFSRYGLDDDDSDSDDNDDVKATPSLETTDVEEQESVTDPKELGGVSRMHAPMDEDESTAFTDMSASERLDVQEEIEEETHVHEIVRGGEEAYAMLTEEVLGNYEEEEAIVPVELLVDEEVEEEEVLLFPNEAVNHIPPPTRKLLKPGIISPSARSKGICSRLAANSGINSMSSSNVDVGMRMRSSFRVGWRPDGSFIQLKPNISGSPVLVQSKPDIAPSPTDKITPLPLLQIHQKHSVTAIETHNECPILTLPKNVPQNGLFDALEDYSQSPSTEKIVSNSFSLLMSLYCEDKFSGGTMDESRRLQSVSSWLKGAVASDTMQAISSSHDIYGKIFSALSGGDSATASALALDSGNPRLSLMLANTGIQAKPFCDSQLELWNKSGAQSFTPTGILRILSLSSGSIDIERQMYKSDNTSYNIDWRRRFGMHLWSCSSDEASVSSIIEQYTTDFTSGLAPPPIPLYCDNSTTKTSNQCILFKILKNYRDKDMPLADIVAPSSHSAYHHDFSATLHLCASMTALTDSTTLSHHQESLIVDSVASQLIAEGSWEWAVYASLCHISGSDILSEASASARRIRAKYIISRFYAPSTDPSAEHRRSFLQSVGVPLQWFIEAQAYRAQQEGDVFRMLDNLMKFSVKESVQALESLVIPHMILEGKESRKQLLEILASLKSRLPPDDSLPCVLDSIYKFLGLQVQMDKLAGLSSDEIEASNIDLDNLISVATDLEDVLSKVSGKTTSNLFYKLRHGFTKVPLAIVFVEVQMMLSMIRTQLFAVKKGDILNLDDESLGSPSNRAFSSHPDGLFDNSAIIRECCGFQAL